MSHLRSVSFELSPARDDAATAALADTVSELDAVSPEFFSITYGAGGSAQDSSLATLRHIVENTNADAMAHVTCVGTSPSQAQELLTTLDGIGVRDVLALRGDQPRGDAEDTGDTDLASASELVALVRAFESSDPQHTGARIGAGRIAVGAFPAGHGAARSARQDIAALRAKVGAGATHAITQILFDADDFVDYRDRARNVGVTIPILPGVMIFTSATQLRRMSELAEQEPPAQLLADLEASASASDRAQIGLDHAHGIADGVLQGGADHLHLYTSNRHEHVLALLDRLNSTRPTSSHASIDRQVAS